MAIRYPLKSLEREALWEAYNRLCYYCRQSLTLRGMEVDHLVPQDRADDGDLWRETCRELGLADDFDVQGLENLVPACRICNGDKSDRAFNPGRLSIDLNAIRQRRLEVEHRFKSLSRRDRSARAKAAMAVAVAEGAMQMDDLRDFARSQMNDAGIFRARFGWLFEHHSLIEVDRADIEGLLDKPIEAAELDDEGLLLSGPDGAETRVKTLRSYRDAVRSGFFAANSYGMAMESRYFTRPLELLAVIAAAKYPETSYMSSPFVGLCDLDRLPATLLFVTEEMTSDPAFAGQRGALEGKTIQDLVADGDARVRSISSQHIQIEHNGGLTFLMELMRADINDDGLEELVIHRGVGPIHGTHRSASVTAVTIREAEGSFISVTTRSEQIS